MRAELTREFTFEAAHRLTGVGPTHKCASLHGHTYRVEITVAGEVDPATGMVLDFARLSAAWQPLAAELSGRLLNELPGLANPTSELLAAWLWQRLKPELPELAEVAIRETATAVCRYRGA